mgnify:CR=1 FL=1
MKVNIVLRPTIKVGKVFVIFILKNFASYPSFTTLITPKIRDVVMGLVCHVNLHVSIFSDDESLNDNFYKQLSLGQRGGRA